MMRDCNPDQYFFDDSQMDFEVQILLGICHYGASDAGEVLATIQRIAPGDFEGWYQQWRELGERIRAVAEKCAAEGNTVSSRRAFLRAATYFAASSSFIDGTKDPSRGKEIWQQHLFCWEEFCAMMNPPVDQVNIPYENSFLPGYFFRPDNGPGPWPVIIFNNGSDGSTSGMWSSGVAAAVERGYAALVFDGPGQNAMFWEHDVPFRHDWEKVITPVVDYLISRVDIDPKRIALSGISQGGYWVLRALAFEHRIAAGIADPGVMDVSTSFFRELPREMSELLDSGQEEAFNAAMDEGLKEAGEAVRQMVLWRMKPYMAQTYYEQYQMVRKYTVRDVINQIQCPMFIADPENEQFWPGQSQEVFDALSCPKTLVRFTQEEGADFHCEPKARSLYDQRVFDWLASVMPPS